MVTKQFVCDMCSTSVEEKDLISVYVSDSESEETKDYSLECFDLCISCIKLMRSRYS